MQLVGWSKYRGEWGCMLCVAPGNEELQTNGAVLQGGGVEQLIVNFAELHVVLSFTCNIIGKVMKLETCVTTKLPATKSLDHVLIYAQLNSVKNR